MTVTEADYIRLTKRLDLAKQERAVLLAKESEKAEKRRILEEKLRAAGVDPSKPEEELARLEAEVKTEYERQKARIDEFERALTQANEEKSSPSQTPQTEVPEATQAKAVLPADHSDLT